MLVISRKNRERVWIGEALVEVRYESGRVRLAIQAPREIIVRREEVEPRPIYRGVEVTG